MKSIPYERPPGDVVARNEPPRFYYPLATVRCEGTPVFRTQAARDFACLLDLDPEVDRWSCDGVELRLGDDRHATDFAVTSVEGRSFFVEVAPPWAAWPRSRSSSFIMGTASRQTSTGRRASRSSSIATWAWATRPVSDWTVEAGVE